jgi:aminopeptidase YwaD
LQATEEASAVRKRTAKCNLTSSPRWRVELNSSAVKNGLLSANMKKQLLSFLLSISFVFNVSAQAFKPTEAEKNLRTHVAYLTSDQLAGRRTGETGATSAAGYVANMFAQYKLKAGFSQTNEKGKAVKSYMQPFPYISGVEAAQTGNEFKLSLKSADNRQIQIENTPSAVKLIEFSPNGEAVNAPVVFAGYGIVSGELKYDDYAELDVRNKIVLAFEGTPENNPRSGFARFDARAKALIAKEKGAVGLLLISREAKLEDDKLAQLKYDQTLGEAALPTFIVSRGAAQSILGINEKDLKTAEDLTAMKKDTGLKLKIGFRDTSPVVNFKVNLAKKQIEAYNVIGILEGNDSVLRNEAIVIGAHYDHLGKGGRGSLAVNSTETHHGADDNASGVSAMLELARALAKEKKNKRTLVFIAFGGEEEGLLGSKFYVNNPAVPLARTVAMINLDMVGRLNENKLTVGGIGTASEWNEAVKRKNDIMFDTNNGYGVGGKFALQLNEDGFGPSDHSSFYGKQIPVLFFFTGTHGDYHKPSDTADKINYEGLLKITNFVGEIVKSVDQNPTRPTYTQAKSSMNMGGRTGFDVSLGTVPSYAEGKGDGLLLDGVREDSPAAKTGLKAGDKIVKLAGRDIRNISDYTFVLGEMKAGEEYEIIVARGAEILTLKIVPAARK